VRETYGACHWGTDIEGSVLTKVPVYTKTNVHKEHGGGRTEHRLTVLSKDVHQVPSSGLTKLQSHFPTLQEQQTSCSAKGKELKVANGLLHRQTKIVATNDW